MATDLQRFTISFPEEFDERAEFEMPSRGYMCDVIVQLDDGKRYRLFFTDVVRLQQTLADDIRDGREYYTEPGMVILPIVTIAAIEKAVAGLYEEGFFSHCKPLD